MYYILLLEYYRVSPVLAHDYSAHSALPSAWLSAWLPGKVWSLHKLLNALKCWHQNNFPLGNVFGVYCWLHSLLVAGIDMCQHVLCGTWSLCQQLFQETLNLGIGN